MLRFIQWLIRLEWPARVAGPLIGRYNPFVADFRRDPYPQYAALRESHPFYRSRLFGVWVVSRYEHITAILRHPDFSADRRETPLFQFFRRYVREESRFRDFVQTNLLMIDPPAHRRLRGLVSKAFTPRRVEGLRHRTTEIVDRLLDEAADRGGDIDLMKDFANPLPITVIAEMLGVPEADRPQLKRWSDDLVLALDPLQAEGGFEPMARSYDAFGDYLDGLFAARRRRPADDLISALVQVEEAGDRLTPAELLSLCVLILVAGHETTTNLIGNGVLTFLRHPGAAEWLAAHPERAPDAVEELLRFDSPVQLTDRVAAADVTIGGHRFARGDWVWLLLGAANRDPRRFPDPDRLDLTRGDRGHLSFSQGIHYCLGAPLARMEGEVALTRLVQRFPRLEGPLEPPDWKRSSVLRGPTALPLRLRA